MTAPAPKREALVAEHPEPTALPGPAGRAAPWLFGLTSVPFGVVAGFCSVIMPKLARDAGISVEAIGWYGFATLIPPMLQFLYAPIVDLVLPRRIWLMVVSALSAVCIALAVRMQLPAEIGSFMVLAVLGQLTSGLVSSCNGGLIAAILPSHQRGQASGFLNVGNLGGSALGATVTVLMLRKCSIGTASLGVAALIFLPSLAALLIIEPPRPRLAARTLLGTMMKELWATARSRPGWTGILCCLSPVGTAALMNFFSALAHDYRADHLVETVNGVGSGLVTALGALIGGWLCDRMDRRRAYLVSGGLTALCGAVLLLAPITPTTYAVGVTVYLLISGVCYTTFYAMVLETVGRADRAAATLYTLYTSAGNAAIAYTGLLDTRFHSSYGPKGLFAVDALANAMGVVALSLLLQRFLRRPPREA